MNPQEIENLSFKIIEQEAGPHSFNKEQWQIIRRMIHTSADFEYLDSIRFSNDAVKKGIQAIQNGHARFLPAGKRRERIGKQGFGTKR